MDLLITLISQKQWTILLMKDLECEICRFVALVFVTGFGEIPNVFKLKHW